MISSEVSTPDQRKVLPLEPRDSNIAAFLKDVFRLLTSTKSSNEVTAKLPEEPIVPNVELPTPEKS